MEALELEIANRFGTVDVRNDLPESYVHVEGLRLQPLCRKLKIKFAQALVGYEERGRNAKFGYKPEFYGVVVPSESAPKLLEAIEQRDARAAARPIVTDEMKRARKERKQQRDTQKFLEKILDDYPQIPPEEAKAIAEHTCVIGSGRVGRSNVYDFYSPVELAVRAHIRHNHTAYESILSDAIDRSMSYEERQDARSDARQQVEDEIDEVVERWSKPNVQEN